MGCGGSTEIVVHPGFAEVLTIQAFVRQEFAAHTDIHAALAFAMDTRRDECAAKGGDQPTLEQLAHQITNEKRALQALPNPPPGMPEGTLRANLEQLEHTIARKVRPKVRHAIAHIIPKKDHGESERDAAAENAMCSAIHVCLMQEVFEFFAPAHYAQVASRAAAEPEAAATEYRHEEQHEQHADPNADAAVSYDDEGGRDDHHDDAAPPTEEESAAPASVPQTPTHAQEEEEPERHVMPEATPAVAPTAGPPTSGGAAAADGDDAPPVDQAEAVALRYPLPEGDWVQSEDNEEFWWSDEQGLFYFPAAGHFMDPESGMWYVADTDEWLESDDHDALLVEMAERGDY